MLDRPFVHATANLDVLSEVLRALRLDYATFDRSDLGCKFAFDLHYVARWRMQLAMEWLRVDSMSVAQAAQPGTRVGPAIRTRRRGT